jgi:Tfp pilus assembly protein PilO
MINLPKPSFRHYLSQVPAPVRKKSQKWAPTVAALFLTTFFIIFAIRPTVITISELLAEIKAREELSQKLRTKVDQIFAAQALYNQIYDRLYLLDQTLPTNPDFARFSQALEGNRLEANLTLKTLNYSSIVLTEKTSQGSTKESQNFIFSSGLTGNYPNLKALLDNIFHQRRIVYIDNLKISQAKNNQDQEGPANLPLIISLNGKAFYLGYEQNKE